MNCSQINLVVGEPTGTAIKLYANKDKSYGTQNIWTHNMITQKSKRVKIVTGLDCIL
jgi:hypothetical protein